MEMKCLKKKLVFCTSINILFKVSGDIFFYYNASMNSGQVQWTCTGWNKTLPPPRVYHVWVKYGDVNMTSQGGCLPR